MLNFFVRTQPRPLWTGKQLFSMICPKINYRGKSKNHVDDAKISDPFNYLGKIIMFSVKMITIFIVNFLFLIELIIYTIIFILPGE